MGQVNTSRTSDKLKANAQRKNQGNQGNKGQHLQAAPDKQREVGSTLISTIKDLTTQKKINESLPKHIKAERMVKLAITAIRNNPKLAQCEPYSFLGAVMEAAQLGLEPNSALGEGYIIPYYHSKRGQFEARFQMGYQGLLSLAHRTNKFAKIYAHEVYEGEHFEYELGLNKRLVHIPDDMPKGEPIRYYACYHLTNGGHDFFTWSRERIQHHAETFSQSVDKESSPWNTNFDAMAKKTMLKEVMRYAPKSVELAEQMQNDGAVISINENGEKNTTYVHEMQLDQIEGNQE